MDTQPSPLFRPRDLATHFMECGRLNTNLTLAPGDRVIITNDMLDGSIANAAALAMAAVVARDSMVARAALLPLGTFASRVDADRRKKYERLFALIEESAFDEGVRDAAEQLLATRFRESQIQDLADELGGTILPARQRYREFLDKVKLLGARKISESSFLGEFQDFTHAVAGKLDFGIYALCVDRLFVSPRIPVMVKVSLIREILRYPPLIRKELMSGLLASSQAEPELIRYAEQELSGVLSREQMTEITLFTLLKRTWAAQKDRAAAASSRSMPSSPP